MTKFIRNILLSSLTLTFLFIIYNLAFIVPTHAQCAQTDWKCVIGGVTDPTGVPGNSGDEQLSNFVSRIIELIFIAAGVVFTFMIILGAFQWMTSSGEKEALSKARGRITHAIIGLVLLSLAFIIINIIGNITGIGILKGGQNGILPFQPPRVPPANINLPQQPAGRTGPF